VAVGQSLATVAVIVVLSTLLAFYLLLDGGRAWTRIVTRARPEIAGDLDGAARRAVEVLGGYMIGTGVISFVGAASQLVIMLLLGIPLAVPVFVLSFILCFIPYIGGFISTGLALLLTIAYGSPEAIAVMVVWTIVFNLVTGNIVSPLVYGKTVHLHPAIVLVAIPAGAAVAGILGMFVVVPALGVVAATWRSVLGIIGQRRHALKPGGSPAPEAELPARQPVATIPGEAAPSG
jgi:predicted PurR-regulated permease PerM